LIETCTEIEAEVDAIENNRIMSASLYVFK